MIWLQNKLNQNSYNFCCQFSMIDLSLSDKHDNICVYFVRNMRAPTVLGALLIQNSGCTSDYQLLGAFFYWQKDNHHAIFIYIRRRSRGWQLSQLDIKKNNTIWGCQLIIVFLLLLTVLIVRATHGKITA